MKKTDTDFEYDVLIVLGARVKPDRTPSEALLRRMTLALTQYGKRPAPVICCGAKGKDEPCCEGDFMCEWLAGRGIPGDALLPENASYDTLQNIANAKEIMQRHGLCQALVITSDYHLRRALAICRRMGVAAQGVGSPSSPAYWLRNNLREILAWGKYYLSYFIKL